MGRATSSLDQNFKGKLGVIKQWFHVLSEAEQTATVYAMVQQTTQMQTRFSIQVGFCNKWPKATPCWVGPLALIWWGGKMPCQNNIMEMIEIMANMCKSKKLEISLPNWQDTNSNAP
ncbi:hypothetical protein BJX64DRAFT_251721 [Aspergillus heterothallicus]